MKSKCIVTILALTGLTSLFSQDTLVLFDPNTYQESVYIMDFSEGSIQDRSKNGKDRSAAECSIITIGLTPVFTNQGKSQSQLMTPAQLEQDLTTGIGLLTFDQCMGKRELQSYKLKVVYGEAWVAEYTMADFNKFRSDKPSLHRLLLNAKQVEISDIKVQSGVEVLGLPDVMIKVQ